MPILPRPRLLALALVPGVVLLGATWTPVLAPLALVAGSLVLLAIALDVRLSASPGEVRLERRHDRLLSIGVRNAVHVRVENDSRQALTYLLRDEAPDAFRTEPVVIRGRVPARGEAEEAYTVVPFRRGEYRFGAINLRYRSALGLLERQVGVATEGAALVYPDILELRKHTLTARSAEDETFNRLRVRGGTEFERLREYTPDDPYRTIDWNATARVRKPIARQFGTERNQHILLAYDLGRQMTSPYGELLKVDYAINSGVVLGYVGAQRGEHVGLLTFADGVRAWVQPRSGMAQFKRLLDELYTAQPELVEPDYAEALAYLSLRTSRRSLVVLFTDLADGDAAKGLLRAVSLLQPKHLPLVVLLRDPALGQYADAEPHDVDDLYRGAVAQRLIEEREALVRTLEARGVGVVDVPAERLSIALLDAYLRLKSRAAL